MGEDKDKKERSLYRPISVPKVDYKLFASILSKRLECIVPVLVDLDQTGFVLNRQTHHLKRTIQVLGHITSENISAMLVRLDTEKAFNLVDWKYLCRGFKEDFIKCIEAFYFSPTTRIRVDGHLSPTIYLERGTHQVCPLSPTLFALFIEPLAQAIREDSEIKGIMIRGEEHKTCMFADDVLLLITSPESSIPKLMSPLKRGYYNKKLQIK